MVDSSYSDNNWWGNGDVVNDELFELRQCVREAIKQQGG